MSSTRAALFGHIQKNWVVLDMVEEYQGPAKKFVREKMHFAPGFGVGGVEIKTLGAGGGPWEYAPRPSLPLHQARP